MNTTIYLFSSTLSYEQYPNDSTSRLFQGLLSRAEAPEQLLIHREGDLVYYVYIRAFGEEPKGFWGFSFILNGEHLIGAFEKLMKFCEQQLRYVALQGDLLQLDDYGNIRRTNSTFHDQLPFIESLVHKIRKQLSRLDLPLALLPPTNYGIDRRSFSRLSVSEQDVDILRAVESHAIVALLQAKDYEDPLLRRYGEQLRCLAIERDDLKKRCEELQSSYCALNRQKKQYKKVMFLSLLTAFILCLSSVGFFVFRYHLRSLRQDALEQSSQNKKLTAQNERLEQSNQELSSSYAQEQRKHEEARSLLDGLTQGMPLVVRGIEVAMTSQTSEVPNSFSSKAHLDRYLWVAIEYKEIEEALVDLQVEVYRREDNIRVASIPLSVQTLMLGEGSRKVVTPAISGDWIEGEYEIEVRSGEVVLSSKRVYIDSYR